MRRSSSSQTSPWEGEIQFKAEHATLNGSLQLPAEAVGLVIFAHGSGSSRLSSRNRQVARHLQEGGFGTFLFDLLTEREEHDEAHTGHLRFDIEFLANRLGHATRWAWEEPHTQHLPFGYFGASTGAAAALVAAAIEPASVRAIVSRGGRPDLADEHLPHVLAPTLLIVGGDDVPVIPLNKIALARLRCTKQLDIVPGATHLFEEPGTLERVAQVATAWFDAHLRL